MRGTRRPGSGRRCCRAGTSSVTPGGTWRSGVRGDEGRPTDLPGFAEGSHLRTAAGSRRWQGRWRRLRGGGGGYGRPVDRGVWTAKTVKRPRQQPAHPQYANYWAPMTRKRHTMPHSAQSQHTNHWAPRTRKRHQQEHRPQRPTESTAPFCHSPSATPSSATAPRGCATPVRAGPCPPHPVARLLLPIGVGLDRSQYLAGPRHKNRN